MWSENFRSPDRAKVKPNIGGHVGSKSLSRVNMKDRVGRLRRRKLGPPLAAIFGFTR